MESELDIFELAHADLRASLAFEWIEGLGLDRGRIELWDEPDYSTPYVIGADFSYGIQGKDFDAACVLDVGADPWLQVGEAHGHWGEDFHRVLWALGWYFNHAWILGEAQVGLTQLRLLFNKLHYHRLYHNRNERKKGRPMQDVIGHWSQSHDITVRRGRLCVLEQRVIARSPMLFSELDRFAFVPKVASRQRLLPEEMRDRDVKMEASVGHDDLVRAFCNACYMADQLDVFAAEEPKYAEGTMGKILDHAGAFDDDDHDDEPDPFGRAR